MTYRHPETGNIVLRRATEADSERLFLWRNHEAVRRYSGNPSPIVWEDHQAWLAQTLSRPDTRILLIGLLLLSFPSEKTLSSGKENSKEAFGVLRYDMTSDGCSAQVSVYLSPTHIGKGLGVPFLQAGSGWLKQAYPLITRIRASIHPENKASRRVFEKAGYQPHTEADQGQDFQTAGFVEYEYRFASISL